MKNPISLLTGSFLRELGRDRIVWILAAAAGSLVLASLILNEMVVGQPLKATRDAGLSLLSLLGSGGALAMVFSLGGKMVEGRALPFLLARPVRRSDYLTALVGAVWLAAALGLALLTALLIVLVRLGGQTWIAGPLLGLLLAVLETAVVTALAVFFAAALPPAPALFLTVMAWVAGHALDGALAVASQGHQRTLTTLLGVLDVALPNLELFNHRATLAQGGSVAPGTLGLAALYAGVWVFLLLRGAAAIFRRREL